MSGTNPGAWPDQGHGDEEDGKEYSGNKKGNILAGVCPLCGDPIAQGEGRMVCQNCAPQKWDSRDFTDPCYTAADLKAARIETVERCMSVVIEAMQKIREEINES